MGWDSIENDIDDMMVSHVGIDIVPINVLDVLLDRTSHFEGYDLIVSLVCLVVIAIVNPKYLLNTFPCIMPLPVSLPPFESLALCTQADICQPLFLVPGECDLEEVIHLEEPSF